MLPPMSAAEFTTLDRILQRHEDELIEETLAELSAVLSGGPSTSGAARPADLERIQSQLYRLYGLIQDCDAAPTPAIEEAGLQVLAEFEELGARVEKLLSKH